MKIIGSDYDGTLRIQKEVQTNVIDAIKAFQEKGNAFGIVTGRSVKTLKDEMKLHGIQPDFAICNNGGVILDKDFNVLEIKTMPTSIAKEILETVKPISPDGISINDGIERAHIEKNEQNSESLEAFNELLSKEEIAQVVVNFEEQEKANAMAQRINELFSHAIHAYANVGCVDIVPKGCSKANGLAYIVDLYKYDKNNVYALGDSYNDVSMIEAFHGGTFHSSPKDIQVLSTYLVEDSVEFINIISNL